MGSPFDSKHWSEFQVNIFSNEVLYGHFLQKTVKVKNGRKTWWYIYMPAKLLFLINMHFTIIGLIVHDHYFFVSITKQRTDQQCSQFLSVAKQESFKTVLF